MDALEATLAHRLRQLADDPTVPLFFGRIDRADGPAGERHLHIGRRHVSDQHGDPMIIDWRAPASVPFYRATPTEPMGVDRRRRFGFHDGELTSYEDEDLVHGTDGLSSLVESEVERPRVGPMRDIVATIQPEQDRIVRADLTQTVCVQGAPGTGKTAVGLHRAAYLLYAYREQLTRRGVLVVGPNASFLRYIREVLPALGEIDATQVTIDQLVARPTHAATKAATTGLTRAGVRGTESAAVATLKGQARMGEVLRRALWSHVSEPSQALVVPRGSRRWRVTAAEAAATIRALCDQGVRYDAARTALPRALAHHVLVQMERAGESPDDRVQDAMARTPQVKTYVAGLWPKVDPAKLVWRLFSDPDFLADAADGILTGEEQEQLTWSRPPRSAGATRWTLADAVLIDEARDLVERTPSVAHIVVDEAQDLSPMMLRALARRCTTGSFTILGDLAQATTPWATRSWSEALHHLGKPEGHVEELTRGFRVPADVIDYAARLLPSIAPGLSRPVAARRTRGELTLTSAGLDEILADALAREGSIALIVPDASVDAIAKQVTAAGHIFTTIGTPGGEEGEFGAHFDLVPASLAKSLEFDHVVLEDPAGIVAGEPDRLTGLRRLYVCLTRAVTTLAVRHNGDLPAELTNIDQ